jgi:hypothetical protein
MYQTELGQGSRHMSNETLNLRNNRLRRGLQAVESTAKKEQDALTNPRWTSFEREDRLKEAARLLDGEISLLQLELDQANERLTSVGARLATVQPTTDGPARATLAVEARAVLRNLDAAGRLQLAIGWANKNNADALAALLASPDPLLGEHHEKDVMRMFNELHRPEALANHKQIGLTVEHVSALLEALRNWQNNMLGGHGLPVRNAMGISTR